MPARARATSARRCAAPALPLRGRRHLRHARRRPRPGAARAPRTTRTSTGSTISRSARTISRIVYAATRTGVWRSTRRGATWTRLLEVDRHAAAVSTSRFARRQQRRCSSPPAASFEQATVYRILAGRRATHAWKSVLSEPGMGRTSLAIAPSNPDVDLRARGEQRPGPQGIYGRRCSPSFAPIASGDAGTWRRACTNSDPDASQHAAPHQPVQRHARRAAVAGAGRAARDMGWYTQHHRRRSARSESRLGRRRRLFRSDDGGRTWGLASYWWHRPRRRSRSCTPISTRSSSIRATTATTNQTLIVGNDGGVFRTDNARAAIVDRASDAACIAGRHRVQWHGAEPRLRRDAVLPRRRLPRRRRASSAARRTTARSSARRRDGPDGWRGVFGGDGGYVAIDPATADPSTRRSQWAAMVESTNGGLSFTAARTASIHSLGRARTASQLPLRRAVRAWIRSNAQRLWVGGEYLYRTRQRREPVDEGQRADARRRTRAARSRSRRAATPTASSPAPHHGHILSTRPRARGHIDDASGPPHGRARAGSRRSPSIRATPTSSTPPTATSAARTCFAAIDGGATWRTLDGSGDRALPDIPVHSLVVDPADRIAALPRHRPRRLRLSDGGASWLVEETGFGPVVTEWLSLIRDSSGRRRLFAFTHGRGAWRVDLR